MTWPLRWFGDLSISRRLILLFLLFAVSMAAVAFHLRELAKEEIDDIRDLQTAVEQKQQLIALQTAVSDYAALLDSRQSVIASRDFRGLQVLKDEIEASRVEADEQVRRFGALYPDVDSGAIDDALAAMRQTQDAYLRDVVAGDVIAAARRQKAIGAARDDLTAVIAESADRGTSDFAVISDGLDGMSRDLSFAIGLTITIMVIGAALFLALILFSVSKPLGRLFHAIDGLDAADRAAFPSDQGPPEFRAIGRALDQLGKRVREQRAAEDQLRLSEAKLRQFADCSADVFWETGPDLRYNWVQSSTLGEEVVASNLLGRTRWELVDVDPESDPVWRRHRDDMLKGRSFRDFLYKTLGGRWWRVNGAPVIDQGGVFQGYRGTATDVTEQVAMTEQLRQSQSREAVSRLAGGVAHDVNNLLTVLKSNLELLRDRAGLEAPLGDMLSRCLRATERGAKLTARLLTLGQRQSLHPEPVALGAFLDEFADLVSRTLPSNIEILVTASDGLPPVHADPAMLQDALLNLVINARDAMPEGGRLCLSAKPTYRAEDPTESVVIRIADSGEGMPDDVRERVFEPFFTTKAVGEGSGVGLAMVRGFVEQSGGMIDVESAPGAGTTITLTLPVACTDEHTPTEAAVAEPSLRRGQGEMVLLVEDDDDVRTSVESILTYLGYGVRACPGPAEALTALADTRASIALVISDVVMPGNLHGDDLAAVINERYPDMPVVLMSGNALDGIREDVLALGVPVLAKPVATEALQEILRDRLSSLNTEN